MKLYRLILIIAIFISSTQFSQVQAQKRLAIKKKEFKTEDQEGLKDAWKNVKKANHAFFQKKYYSFEKATELYKKALEYNPDNAELNYNLGISYLFSYPRTEASKYLKRAFELDPELVKYKKFYYARALHLNMEFEEAIIEYQFYLSGLKDSKKKKQTDKITKYIDECGYGQEFVKKPERILVENMEKLNTKFAEYSPVINYQADKLYFTARRSENSTKKKNNQDFKFGEDVFVANLIGDDVGEVNMLSKKINSKGNEGVLSISPDGKRLYLFNGVRLGDIFYTEKDKKGEWKKPNHFSEASYKKSSETAIAFRPDNTEMYFISNKKGNKDIYVKTSANSGKSWKKKPESIGDHINTKYDEASVYVTPDGKYLYFSSKGHNSMGGFDIFRCELKEDGTWGYPQNMGYPVNTPDDDMYFTIHPNNRDAFITSVRSDSKGDKDIYRLTFLSEEKTVFISTEDQFLANMDVIETKVGIQDAVEIKKTQLTIVKGKILDYNTTQPVAAKIEITDNATDETVKESETKPETGEYVVALESGRNYALTVKAEKYMFYSQNFVIADSVKHQEIGLDVKLQPMTEGSKVILKNTFFESGSSTLTSESYGELNRLVRIFEKYPNIIIEISGHTDNKGSKAFNLNLSKTRAQAVADYLKSKGVKEEQLNVAGYYFMFPIESNDTEEGRAQNRRVEAKIIKVGE